jgi:hypothetical protein
MKITKQQLKQIIKEEIEATLDEAGYFDPNREPGEGYPFGKPLPGLRGALKDFVPKSMAHAVGNKSKGLAGNPKYIAAWKAIGKELNSSNIRTFIRAVKMPNAEPDAPLTPHAKEIAKKLAISMDNNKLKAVHSLKDVVSLMGPEGKRRGHAIGSDRDPGYVRE